MLKILVVAENFAPCWAFGGPPKVLFDIARELVKRGHSVTVIATNVLDATHEVPKTFDILEGINVYYLRTLSRRLAWNQKIFLAVGLDGILKKIMSDSDLVVLVSSRTFFSLVSYLKARTLKKPYILLPYGSLLRGTGAKKLLKWTMDHFFGYTIVRNASMVFAQTYHEMEEAKRHGISSDCVKLVPLNIDLSEFEQLPPRGIFRKKLGIGNDKKLILFLGRLHKYKGLELLLKSFSNLSRTRKNYRLVIVGRDDGYLSTMLQLIKNLGLEGKVIFAGPLYGKERIAAYLDADVFVLPSSLYEETSTAALEACAASTPVIITKQASIPGLDSSRAGLTINYDQQELEAALKTVLDNPTLRDTMGRNARKMVAETFSSIAWVNRFEQLTGIENKKTYLSNRRY
jgi:glycosyltransferase involved in cell wall biosynthesis